MAYIQGLSRIGDKPHRRIKSAMPPRAHLIPVPHEKLWRELEDRNHRIVPYNGGIMLRIDDKIDIYPKFLKWRYCKSVGKFNQLIRGAIAQDVINILHKAPHSYIPRRQEKDNSPTLSRGFLRAVKRYRKSI